jgi:hypothetical protein
MKEPPARDEVEPRAALTESILDNLSAWTLLRGRRTEEPERLVPSGVAA